MKVRRLANSVLGVLFGAAVAAAGDSPIPPGWVLFDTKPPDQTTRSCADYSPLQWDVTVAASAVRVMPFEATAERRDPLPFPFKPNGANSGCEGDQHEAQVNDGWLIGCDAGEFGGSLWWASPDGSRRKKLLNQNVQGLARHPGGVLVLTGLAHLTLDSGQAFDVAQARSGGWRLRPIVDLGSEPVAFIAEAPGSLLVLTSEGLWRVTPAVATQLVKAELPYPTAIALLPTGEVYAGMRLFIVRFVPGESGYHQEWLVPAGCRRFELHETVDGPVHNYECQCLP